MEDDDSLADYSEEEYFDTVSLEFKKLLKSICAQVSHTAFEGHKKTNDTKKIRKLGDWNGYVFFKYVLPDRKEIKARRNFEAFWKIDTNANYKTFEDVQKQGLGKKSALSAFCLSAYVREYDELEDFIKEYVHYCFKNKCALNAFEDHSEIVEKIRLEKSEQIIKYSEKDELNQKLQQSSNKSKILNQLIQTPRYEDTKRDKDNNEVSLSPLDHTSVTFQPRDDEINNLNDFLNSSPAFQMLFLIAPSGAGKTRLITEWFRKCVDSKQWQKGFVFNESTPKKWKAWQQQPILSDTLIVVDYIYRFKDILKRITERGARHSQENAEETGLNKPKKPPRLRLVILDHVLPTDISFEALDSHQQTTVGGDKGSAKHLISNHMHPHSPIYLNQQTPKQQETLIKAIISDVYGIPNDVKGIGLAYETLKRIDKETTATPLKTNITSIDGKPDNHIAFANYPLFAILIGQALKKLKENGNTNDLTAWERSDLISFYFKRKGRIPWENKNPDGLWIGAAISTATALQGLSFKLFFDCAAQEDGGFNGEIKKDIKGTCNHIVSSSNKIELKKYEPDILGETFFLLFFEYIKGDKNARKFFFKALCCEPLLDVEHPATNRRFIEFIQLTARNLSNDNQESVHINEAWESLQVFLTPCNFTNNLDMQLSAILANIEVVQVLKQYLPNDSIALQKNFVDNVNSDDIQFLFTTFYQYHHKENINKAFDSVWYQLLSALGLYIDWLLSQSLLSPELSAQYYQLLTAYEQANKSKRTKIFVPCFNNTQHVLKWLRKQDPAININHQSSDVWNPLLLACHFGHQKITELLLLEKHLEINQALENGWTAFMLACNQGHDSIVKQLLEKDGLELNVTDKKELTALMLACVQGHDSIVKLLLEKDGLELNVTNEDEWTALMLACTFGHDSIVKLLLEKDGLELNVTDENEWTALMMACYQGHGNIVKQLLEKDDLKLNTIDEDEWTALMTACYHGHDSIVKQLLAKDGLELNVTNELGLTALMMAREQGHDRIIKLLLEKGAHE